MPEDKEAAAERKAFAERCKAGAVSPESGLPIKGQDPGNPVLSERVTWTRPSRKSK